MEELKLWRDDPWLEPWKKDIWNRHKIAAIRMAEMAQGEARLADAINNHLYYCSHKEGNKMVFREWAPNATAIYLLCDKTVGWCKDTANDGIIWFVYNSLGYHSIFRYNGVVTKIFYSEPTLGLTDNMVIAEVADGRLYWNDGVSEPKSFNIQKAIDYTAKRGGYINYKPFDTVVFPMIKKPPVMKPKVAYESKTENDGVTIDFNNLRKKQWQAKYNYEYEDYQESAYSPISKVPLPEAEVSPTGKWVDSITRNNALKITVNTGSYNVKAINVAVRDASQKNLSPFFVFKKIDKWVS